MKKVKSLIAIVLVVAMLFSVAGCAGNKLPSIQKAFEKEGYKLDEDSTSAALFNAIIKAAQDATSEEGKDATVKTYMFKNKLKMGMVLEFKSSKELKEFYESSSNTIKGVLKDISESKLMNGNCMLLSFSSDMYDIFAKA